MARYKIIVGEAINLDCGNDAIEHYMLNECNLTYYPADNPNSKKEIFFLAQVECLEGPNDMLKFYVVNSRRALRVVRISGTYHVRSSSSFKKELIGAFKKAMATDGLTCEFTCPSIK